MKIALSTDALTHVKAELLAVGVRAGDVAKDPAVKVLDRATGGLLSRLIKEEDFKGKLNEVLLTPVKGRLGVKRILVVGLGSETASEAAGRLLGTRAAAHASSRFGSVAALAPAETATSVRGTAEGLVLGSYRFARYLTGDRRPRNEVKRGFVVVSKKGATPDTRAAADQGQTLGEGVNFVRDLVNSPPNDLTPTALADAAKAAAAEAGVACQVFDKKAIEKRNMHLLLAVNRGSDQEPRFVHMTYKPAGVKSPRKVAFVGKGLTFDSGGLCIKPAKSMIDMKCDMAGAAVTIATVVAAAKLKLPVEVHGIVGATENMPGGSAYRPGDIFPSLDGKSVEIINTDAEGRLVLADALAYARELGPDFMIDHATLTGACMVALGPWTAGLFANDDELAQRYVDAARDAGESFWRLPLVEDLRDSLKSDVADLKHTGESHGGAISAALFLREFVGKTKWAHMDIAGPAFQDRPHGVHPKGGTGFGVLTAVRFLESLASG